MIGNVSVDSDKIKTDAIPEKPRSKETIGNSEYEENTTSSNCTRPSLQRRPNNNEKPPGNSEGSFNTSNAFSKSGGVVINISDSSGIHFGNNYKLKLIQSQIKNPSSRSTFDRNDYSKHRSKNTKEIPKIIQKAFFNLDTVSEKDLDMVKKKLTGDWHILGQKLCPSDQEINCVKLNNLSNKEAAYEVLKQWRQTHSECATVGILCKDLWDIREEHAAKKLAEAHC